MKLISSKGIYSKKRRKTLEEIIETIESNCNLGKAVGSDLDITDALNWQNQGIAVGGNTTQDTSKLIYKCVGTETGDYYFVYNSTNYQFTMPAISAGDILVFNTTTLKLYLGETEITTTTDNTGTLITLSATPNPNFAVDIVDVTGTQEVLNCGLNLLDEKALFNATFTKGTYMYTKIDLPKNVRIYARLILKPGKTKPSGLNAIMISNNGYYPGNASRNIKLMESGTVVSEKSNIFQASDTISFSYYPISVNIKDILEAYEIMVSVLPNQSYVEYQGIQSTTLHLGDIHLRKIGDYQDKIYKENDKWWLRKEIVEFNLATGIIQNESSSSDPVPRHTVRYLTDYPQGVVNPINALSNCFIINSRETANRLILGTTTTSNWYVSIEDSMSGIVSGDSEATVITKIKNYLDSINSKLWVYALNPTDTEITSQNYPELYEDLQKLDKMQTYREHTLIQITADEGNPAQLEVTYLQDDRIETKQTLAEMQAQILAIAGGGEV